MKLGIDVDGCLAQFNRGYIDVLVKETGMNLFPEGARTRLDEYPISWDYDSTAGYTSAQINHCWRVMHANPKFWEGLWPLPHAKTTVHHLNVLAKQGEDVYFLTNRSGVMAKKQTESWLYKLGMDYPTVILVADKIPVIKALNIKFFIDDKLETVNAVAAESIPDLHLYLRDAPYNQMGRVGEYFVAESVKQALEMEGLW